MDAYAPRHPRQVVASQDVLARARLETPQFPIRQNESRKSLLHVFEVRLLVRSFVVSQRTIASRAENGPPLPCSGARPLSRLST